MEECGLCKNEVQADPRGFQDQIQPDINKYVCAPCSNCKGAIRDMLDYYNAPEKCSIYYGGLVELIVNAMVDVEEFIEMY